MTDSFSETTLNTLMMRDNGKSYSLIELEFFRIWKIHNRVYHAQNNQYDQIGFGSEN